MRKVMLPCAAGMALVNHTVADENVPGNQVADRASSIGDRSDIRGERDLGGSHRALAGTVRNLDWSVMCRVSANRAVRYVAGRRLAPGRERDAAGQVTGRRPSRSASPLKIS